MTHAPSPVLEFPEMLYGLTEDVRSSLCAEGRRWGREYRETGRFTPPSRMRPVLPGEVLFMFPGLEGDLVPRPLWRVGMFRGVYLDMTDGIPEEESARMEEAFESFCLNTPWGALDHSVSPFPPRSAANMARRLGALLRFWDVLQGPRYSYRTLGSRHTLDELVDYIFRWTLDAWCPKRPATVREHLALTVERMAKATREDCIEAVLRVMRILVVENKDLKHREGLDDPDFLRERLTSLPHKDFDSISSAYRFALNGLLCDLDRELERN